MTTNHASGGMRSTVVRSHGSRQNRARKATAPPPLGRGRRAASKAKLSLDRRPGRLPLRIADALLAAVRAGGERGLPELDRVEVGAGRVRVEGGAGPGLQRLHDRAGFRVDRSLAVVQRLLRLDLGGAYPLRPHVGAVGVR